jgi:hypothetical protein
MTFRIKKHERFDITVFKTSGAVSSEQVTEALKSFYEETDDRPTRYALWDLRDASLAGIHHWDALWITQVAEYLGHGRQNGKTAIVASGDRDFEVSRLVATFTPIKLAVAKAFRTLDDAADWFRLDVELLEKLTDF